MFLRIEDMAAFYRRLGGVGLGSISQFLVKVTAGGDSAMGKSQ